MKPNTSSGFFPGRGHGSCSAATFFVLGTILFVFLQGCAAPAVNLGLKAEYPKQKPGAANASSSAAFIRVDSLQPTLRWEPFPREEDADGRLFIDPSAIRDVKYELKIASAGWAYSRENLDRPEHRIEEPLLPATKYFWTVRACFWLEGEPRCTEWGALSVSDRGMFHHPNFWSYRFQTP